MNFAAAAAACLSATAWAQSDVQVSAAAKQVVNPFAAKRQAGATTQPERPIAVPPAETAGPKTYRNPFARQDASPRYITPRLQPGPLSRWHRTGEPPVPHDDPRPIQAVIEDKEPESKQLDLSGPLAIQEQRTALFALPAADATAANASTPPDPAHFGGQELAQPTWLVPNETGRAASRAEVTQSFEEQRAAARPTVDPFEQSKGGEVVVSDDAPAPADSESSLPAQKAVPLPTVVEGPIVLPVSEPPAVATAPTVLPPTVLPSTGMHPTILSPTVAPPTALPPVELPSNEPVAVAAAADADECYTQAEHVASEAASTNELASVVHLCQQGVAAHPEPKLTSELRSLAAWACNRSGEIESDRRRDDEALKAFELAIQWDPNCWLALHNRAVSRAQQGDYQGALADFNRALELNPGLAVAYRNRGELLAATGRTEEAAADYTTALAQLPQDAELYVMRGEAYHRLGHYDEALADLTQAIEIAPLDANAYAQRGNVQAELGHYQQAIADLRQGLSVDRQSSEAHRSLAWLLATCPDQRVRDARQALAAAQQAAQLAAPGDPFVLDTLAAASANAGQFERAIRFQQEAIVNVPADFAAPFQQRLAMYQQHRPFRNGAENLVDQNVRAASLNAAPRPPRQR